MPTTAVITGDVIKSTTLSAAHRQWLGQSIERGLAGLGKRYKFKGEMFRGDSLQCLLAKPGQGLRLALLLKTYVRSLNPVEKRTILDAQSQAQAVSYTKMMFDIRLSLAVGSVTVTTGKVVTSDGEAFQLSGRRLDDMKKLRLTFSVISQDRYRSELVTESVLLDALLSRTSALQCQVLFWKLSGYTEEKIAEKLGIRQAAVNQRAKTAGWHAIENTVKRFEEIYGTV